MEIRLFKSEHYTSLTPFILIVNPPLTFVNEGGDIRYSMLCPTAIPSGRNLKRFTSHGHHKVTHSKIAKNMMIGGYQFIVVHRTTQRQALSKSAVAFGIPCDTGPGPHDFRFKTSKTRFNKNDK